MVGIVLVSHSRKLALALRELVQQMVGPEFPIAVAAGTGEDHEELGTDAVHISEVLEPFLTGDGAVVLMDLGSAVLSAQTAVELLDNPEAATKLRLCPAPIVEAAVAAAVQANAGSSLDEVAREALAALAPKQEQLSDESPSTGATEAQPSATAASAAGESVEFDVVIENPHGLHARPAATLVQSVSRFQSDVQLTNLTARRGPSSARSLTSVSLLQARKGDSVRFALRGPDASTAAAQLRKLAAERFGESASGEPAQSPPSSAEPAKTSAISAALTEDGRPHGVGASEGIAIGRPLALSAALPLPEENAPEAPAVELERLNHALAQVAEELHANSASHGSAAEILAAQALILSDPVLLDAVRARIVQGQVTAARAWREQCEQLAASYSAMEDEYMRARAADVRDISLRVLRAIAGESSATKIRPEPPAILVTTELLPGEAIACDPEHVLGVIATAGSATAHAAILMRTLGIPMVVGAKDISPDALSSDATVALDGLSGEIWLSPSEEELAILRARQQALAAHRASLEATKLAPAITLDGQRIEVLANVANASDAAQARSNGAEGVGLLRTEFVYLAHKQMPSEDQQAASLVSVLSELGPGPVVIRTPDVGADKPLAYLPSADEHNPFLGVRGLRLSFRHPEFFLSNLKAILRAGKASGCAAHDLWIMFPMVTIPEEMVRARKFAQQAHEQLEREGTPHCWPVKLGMMVEVPAAALLAARFAQVADFFSIGTNDLTQYVLASERGNADLAALDDAVNPAVLRLIHWICAQAAPSGCHVSVCGDAASDPVAAALMIGAGVRSLSVRANQVAAIKAEVRSLSAAEMESVCGEALRLQDAVEVRQLAASSLRTQ